MSLCSWFRDFHTFSSQIIPSCEIFLGSSVHLEHWLSDTFVWNSPILSADFSNFPNPALHQAEENKSRPYWITYYLPLWLFLMLTVELNTISSFGEVAVFRPSAFFERSIRTFASTMFFFKGTMALNIMELTQTVLYQLITVCNNEKTLWRSWKWSHTTSQLDTTHNNRGKLSVYMCLCISSSYKQCMRQHTEETVMLFFRLLLQQDILLPTFHH